MVCTYSAQLPLLVLCYPFRVAGGKLDMVFLGALGLGDAVGVEEDAVWLGELDEAGADCRHEQRKQRCVGDFHVGLAAGMSILMMAGIGNCGARCWDVKLG